MELAVPGCWGPLPLSAAQAWQRALPGLLTSVHAPHSQLAPACAQPSKLFLLGPPPSALVWHAAQK